MKYIWAIVTSIAILVVFIFIKVFYSIIIDNYRKEHINELSENVYVALGVSQLIPLIIAIILIRIVWKKITYKGKLETNSNLKSNSLESKDTINNSNPSLAKAVYNHTKDIASEIKPTINEYKEKHQTSKTDISNISSIDEDEIYEKVMLEIEEDNKVKSTWARALAQSEGDRNKAESLYIKLRFNEIKDDSIINDSLVDIVTSTKSQDYNNEEFKINSNEKTNNNSNKKILFVTLFIAIIIILLVVMTKFEKDSSSNYSLKNEEYNKLFLEAKNDFDSKEYDKALPKYEKLVEVNYKPAEGNYYLGEIWYMRKKYDIAISHFKKSAILNDKAVYMPTLLLHSAISFGNVKDEENAKSFYNALIELYPNSNEAKTAKNYKEKNFEVERTSKEIEDKNRYMESSNNNSFQKNFEYKDWKYETADNLFTISTNGKIMAIGHQFGIIREKEQCKNNFIWVSLSTVNDISSHIGENINFRITIDDKVFYQELPIVNVTKYTSTLNVVDFSNIILNNYTLSLLKKGKKLKVEIIETNKLYDKFDVKFEEFSLEGFVTNFLKLEEKCNIKSNNETSKNSLDNELKKYIINYIEKTNKGYFLTVKELYANEIKSFSDISYPKDKVFKEKEKYLKRWDIVQTRLNNIEYIGTEIKTGNYIVKYNINFLVYNTNEIEGIKGEALNTLVLNSDMKIIEEQQTVISKMNFTNPNELIGTFFEQKVNNGNYENSNPAKIIISNYNVSEGEYPKSLLITKYNNKNLVFYESGFYIDSFKYLDKNKILIRVSNVTTERNYIFDLTNNSSIFIGNGSNIEIIKNGEYNGFFKVSGIKTYLTRDDGTSEGAYWFDAIKNIDGKIIKLISKNSKKCIPVKKLLKEKDISYLQQSLNDCIFVD